jgi:small subunit ribosomal protein S6
MYIVDPELTDDELTPIIEKYKKVVTDQGGIIGETGKWEHGRRRLTYEIKGKKEGIYVLMNFEATAETIAELERIFHISDDVLRHLVVRQNKSEE